MAVYLVLSPPEASGDLRSYEQAAALRFVRDGFYWLALFFPLLWLLFNRMWLVFLGYLAAYGVVAALSAGFGPTLSWIILALFSILFAWEAGALKGWTLQKRGWQVVGLVNAANLTEAETRFFERAIKNNQVPSSNELTAKAKPKIIPRIGEERVVGLTLRD
ncbi:DUF2628 domain-containing protein [Rhodobacteraceae bacterium RKSG542]|uniref:DUF2628 domain-containing protein n=1 Tax=Pseudovibrio flavus TaxID=2529854 RepID=UPI0012BB7642|nr:DUF2628 domain-containing protein [Pseudovibrio flavus]MTI17859.1 DUF2628 domain-containing protein [Pseudovibrio flavus]